MTFLVVSPDGKSLCNWLFKESPDRLASVMRADPRNRLYDPHRQPKGQKKESKHTAIKTILGEESIGY